MNKNTFNGILSGGAGSLWWGIIGVLLAAPITAIIKITFEKFETTKSISRFLEGKIHLQKN